MIHLDCRDPRLEKAVEWLLRETQITESGDVMLKVRMSKKNIVRIERVREIVETFNR